jgi:hypothetical protein
VLAGSCQRWVMRRRKAGNEASARGGGWEMGKEDSTSSDSQAEDLDRSDVDVELLQAVEAEAFARQIRSSTFAGPPLSSPSSLCTLATSLLPNPCQNSYALAPCPLCRLLPTLPGANRKAGQAEIPRVHPRPSPFSSSACNTCEHVPFMLR